MYVFDTHQDISDSILIINHGDFWERNGLRDGWNDIGLPVLNQVDYPRLQEGNVKAVVGITCVVDITPEGSATPSANHYEETLKHLDLYNAIQRKKPKEIQIIKTKADLDAIPSHTLSMLLGMEGADSVDEELTVIDEWFSRGVRSVGFTWNYNNVLAGGAKEDGELTERGRNAIAKMNELGIILDLSHLNEKSFFAALAETNKTPFVSHTACLSVTDAPRNLTDEQLLAVAEKGGVISIFGVPKYIKTLTLEHLVKHFKHAVDVAGVDHVGIGSDFAGMLDSELITGFEEVNDMPNLIEAFKTEGFTDADIEKIAHKNVERVFRENLPE